MRLRGGIVVIGLPALYVLLSALFVLGNYQNQNGDFGQYVIHARNLLLGRPWGYLLEGYPSVLPAYSALLVIPTALFGVNAYAYAIINSVLWAGCAVTAYFYFRGYFAKSLTGYVFLFIVLFAPYLIAFQQAGMPNILYAAAAMCALLAGKKLGEGNNRSLRGFVMILLPAIIRTEALALYAALAVFFFIRKRGRLVLLPTLGIGISVILDVALALVYHLKSNFLIGTSLAEGALAAHSGLLHLLQASAYMFLSYVFGFAELLVSPGMLGAQNIWGISVGPHLQLLVGPVQVILVAVAVLGLYMHGHYFSLDKLFLGAHLALLSAFVLTNGVPVRYLLPLLPIFLFYLLFALERGMNWALNYSQWTTSAFLGTMMLVLVAVSAPHYMREPARTNVLFTQHMAAVLDWLAGHHGNKEVGYYKPRLMTLLLDTKSSATSGVVLVRSVEQVDRLLSRGGFVVVRKVPFYNQPEILKYLITSSKAHLLWQDEEHAVFGAAPMKGGSG